MLPDDQTRAEVSPSGASADQLGRPLRSLRVSVTDRCNLRCNYCMPEENYVWLPRQELLTFEEITRLVEVFTSVGVTDVRLTGGEPLLRRDLPRLVQMLAANRLISMSHCVPGKASAIGTTRISKIAVTTEKQAVTAFSAPASQYEGNQIVQISIDVRAAAGHDERPEAEKHPTEGNVPPFAGEVRQSDGDRQVGERNQGIRYHVQPDQAPSPQVARSVRAEPARENHVLQELHSSPVLREAAVRHSTHFLSHTFDGMPDIE